MKLNQVTCPWWFLFTFDNPFRRLFQDPVIILGPYLKPGDAAVDIGCGMGYFTLPLARLVGSSGYVIAVDLQKHLESILKLFCDDASLSDVFSIGRNITT